MKIFFVVVSLFVSMVARTQVILSTDYTDSAFKKSPLHNIWSVANRISPRSGSNVRPDLKTNIVRMVGGIIKKVNGVNVKDLEFDPCIYDSITNKYVYKWDSLIDRLNEVVKSQSEILQIVLDQPPWAFQHGYQFIPKGTRDSIHFREDEQISHYGNSLPPAHKVEYHKFIKALMIKLIDVYGEKRVLSWRFRVGSEIETPDHWRGTKQDFIEHFANTEKAIRSVLPHAKVGVHTRIPGFLYKEGAVLNYKGEPFSSFTNDLISYCHDNNIRYDFWGISDYVIIGNSAHRDISSKYNTLFAPLVNHPKWNSNATLDIMEYATVTTMTGKDGTGFINSETTHAEIVELAFSNLFYKNRDKGLEYIYRWGNRIGSTNPLGIQTLNTMVGKIRYKTEVSGASMIENNELDAIFSKAESINEFDVLIYNFNAKSLLYQKEEQVNITFSTDLPIGTTICYRSLSYGETNNKLQSFLKDNPSYLKTKTGEVLDVANFSLSKSALADYINYNNPNPSKYSYWKYVVTTKRNDNKEGSIIRINTEISSFAFKKFEFREEDCVSKIKSHN